MVGAGLLLPTIAKLNSAPTAIDALMFYLVGIAVWGSVLSAILFAWYRIRAPKPEKISMSSQPILMKCPTCGFEFQFGPHRYDGKYLRAYQLTVCMSCYRANHDGWAPHLEPSIAAVLTARGLELPARNENDLLPRE